MNDQIGGHNIFVINKTPSMRLLYVLNARLPSERAHTLQVMKTCDALERSGVMVTLVVPWRFGRIKQDPFAFYGMRTQFPIVRLPSIDLSRFGRFGFLVCSLTFSVSFALYLLFLRPDVIFGRDELPLLVASFFRRKIFWEAHDGRYNAQTKLLLSRLDGLVTITASLKRMYQEKGYAGPVRVSPDGVDLEDFRHPPSKHDARARLGLPTEGPYAFYIGSLQSWKGHGTFLEASRLLPNVRFVVVGGYPHQIQVLQQKYLDVVFLGERPYRELPMVQQAADVLVIPNTAKEPISALYTSPLKLFAHMASGVPVVVSDVPALREVLTDESAFFFAPDDASCLAESINQAISSSEEAQKRAGTALREAEKYSWIRRGKGIVEFIRHS